MMTLIFRFNVNLITKIIQETLNELKKTYNGIGANLLHMYLVCHASLLHIILTTFFQVQTAEFCLFKTRFYL